MKLTSEGQVLPGSPIWNRGALGFAVGATSFLLLLDETHIVRLDHRLRDQGRINTSDVEPGSPYSTRSHDYYDWAFAGDILIFYGAATNRRTGMREMGFYRQLLPPPGSYRGTITEQIKLFPEGEVYHALGYRNITVIDSTAYFLAFRGGTENQPIADEERRVALYRFDLSSASPSGEPQRLLGLPEENNMLPKLPPVYDSASSLEALNQLGSSPRGILSQNGILFVPYRSDEGSWKVSRLEPASSGSQTPVVLDGGVLHLPVKTASNILIIPTPSRWLVFEESRTERKRFDRLWMLPIEWIDDQEASPLYRRNTRIVCR